MRVFLQDLLEPHFLTATFFANFLMRRPGHGCLTNFFCSESDDSDGLDVFAAIVDSVDTGGGASFL